MQEWNRQLRCVREAEMKRTWYQPSSGAPPFRNCGLIDVDRRRPENWLPGRQRQLTDEWWETFRRGVMRPGSTYNPAEPGPHDRFIAWDDSQEATDRWVERFLKSNGKDVGG